MGALALYLSIVVALEINSSNRLTFVVNLTFNQNSLNSLLIHKIPISICIKKQNPFQVRMKCVICPRSETPCFQHFNGN